MSDKKNFRSNYYEKIGFKSVDIKKSLESILSEPILDKAKLAQFVIKYELPAQYRVIVWKYLLSKHGYGAWDGRRISDRVKGVTADVVPTFVKI